MIIITPIPQKRTLLFEKPLEMFHFSKNYLPSLNQFNGKGLALVIFIPPLSYITTAKSIHVYKPFETLLMATSLMGTSAHLPLITYA